MLKGFHQLRLHFSELSARHVGFGNAVGQHSLTMRFTWHVIWQTLLSNATYNKCINLEYKQNNKNTESNISST